MRKAVFICHLLFNWLSVRVYLCLNNINWNLKGFFLRGEGFELLQRGDNNF